MRRILVTGGLGNLGRSVLSALHFRGYQIRALRLPQEPPPHGLPPGIEIVAGDVANPSSLKGLADGMDAVLHAAGVLQAANSQDFERVNHQGTRHLIEESQRVGVRHFILVSSISVTYPRLSPYALSKKQAEEALQNSRLSWKTIVRPTLIYNDDGGAAEFAALVKHIAKFPWVPLPDGGRAKKRPIHADDAANCLASIPLQSVCDGRVYSMAGEDVLTLREMVLTIAEQLGLKRRILSIPKPTAMMGALFAQAVFPGGNVGMQGLYGLVQDAAPNIDTLKGDLGFSPRTFAPTPNSLRKAIRG